MPKKKLVHARVFPKKKEDQPHLKKLLMHQKKTKPLPKTMKAYEDNAPKEAENKYLKEGKEKDEIIKTKKKAKAKK
tara:strand:+ start:1347 stop:1574 length:228 start_codon:yes stop_codon:yes gene_type:complete